MMTPTVGIFSRSEDTEYAWLTDRLGECCDVLPVYISNYNRHVLIQSLSQCRFAILYHTKNRGRINITDVTDSIYDEEIRLLSDRLGEGKVLAVIDDLEDSSEKTKDRILDSQFTLRNKTEGNVFLFTKEEKRNQQRLREKVQPIIDLIQRGTVRAPKPAGPPGIIPEPGQEKEKKINSRGSVSFLVVLALSGIMCQELYRSPDGRNWFLACFWTVGAFRAYFRKPSHVFWFHPRIHSMFSWIVTLASLYNFSYRQSISDVALPAFWLPASLGLLHVNRRQSHLISELLVQIVLSSPYTLAVL
ncbi:uncharacterized protein LOC120942926 isoform X2 [Rana temporaria]|uniref:uncharacterized protein LOC120942926 isoform X2 n=1 Tax=Rana temporaria TaxID=8407 RepID=UPI001AADD88D|nr:uncharacterized protein LOC120942926 isoform X2 [Rana temporaria]